MAETNSNPSNGNGKSRGIMADNGSPAFVHLESRVGHLESAMLEIKSMVQKLVDRPVNPGLTQVLGTLATTLVVIGFIFNFAKYNLTEAMQPTRAEIATVSRLVEKLSDEYTKTQIRLAVLEERANWIRSQTNWTAKADRAQ